MTPGNSPRPLGVEDPDAAATTRTRLPVVVIGAGPVGLAAAAHLLDRGLEPLVLEAGPQVGANIAQWRHVRLFSPGAWPWTRSARACSIRPAGLARTPMRCPPAPTCCSSVWLTGDQWRGDDLADARGLRVGAHQVLAATGFRPDHSIAAELRLALEPALESPTALGPLIDPNVHTCGTVPAHGMAELAHPEPGYVVVGMKSYGRAPTFLLATGYQQVRSVVAILAGDEGDAATRHGAQEPPAAAVCAVNRTLLARAVTSLPSPRAAMAAPDSGTAADWSATSCCA
jgi:hypothetical protein